MELVTAEHFHRAGNAVSALTEHIPSGPEGDKKVWEALNSVGLDPDLTQNYIEAYFAGQPEAHTMNEMMGQIASLVDIALLTGIIYEGDRLNKEQEATIRRAQKRMQYLNGPRRREGLPSYPEFLRPTQEEIEQEKRDQEMEDAIARDAERQEHEEYWQDM
jgi:hypothetical protein